MIRTFLLATMLALACSRPVPPDAPEGGGGKKEENEKENRKPAPLTEQERMDWRKHSRGWEKPTLTVAALRRDGWVTFRLSPLGPEWKRHAAGSVYFPAPDFPGVAERMSKEDATREAARPGTTAAVIVDLASDPIAPVLWFMDNGDGPKETKEAPSQELAASLANYLLETQRKAPLAR